MLLGTVLFVTTTLTWAGFSFSMLFCKSSEQGVARVRVTFIEKITASATIALLSVQLFLTLATVTLFASYDGSLVASAENTWREQGYEFALQHCISFFFSCALYAGRFECAELVGPKKHDEFRLQKTVRRISFYVPTILLGVCWAVTLVAKQSASPYGSTGTTVTFFVGCVAAAVPWVVVGVGV
jgi:hypothetical protein